MRPAAKVKRQYFKVTQFLGFEDTLFHNSAIINFPLENVAILGTEKKIIEHRQYISSQSLFSLLNKLNAFLSLFGSSHSLSSPIDNVILYSNHSLLIYSPAIKSDTSCVFPKYIKRNHSTSLKAIKDGSLERSIYNSCFLHPLRVTFFPDVAVLSSYSMIIQFTCNGFSNEKVNRIFTSSCSLPPLRTSEIFIPNHFVRFFTYVSV